MTKSTDFKEKNNSNNLLNKSLEKYKNVFFKIFYDNDKHIYYLLDLGIGYGTFFKIEEDASIKENTIVNIGESYLVFTFQNNDLYLKIYSNEKEYNPMIIQSNDKIYQIGRSDKCEVYIKDKMLSRIHCILFYIDNNWYIKDGNESGNESTNGTWVYANEEAEIKEGMKFKSNSCNFLCKFQ